MKKIIVIAMIAFIAYMPESISAMASRPLQRGGLLAKSAHLVHSLGSTGSTPSYNSSTNTIVKPKNDVFRTYMQSHPTFEQYKTDPGLKKVAAQRYAKGQGDYSDILNKIATEQFSTMNPQLELEFKKEQEQSAENVEVNRLRNLQLQTNKYRDEWAQESKDRLNAFDAKMKKDRQQNKANHQSAQEWQEQWDNSQLPQFLRMGQ